jgi:hypothetical protein
MLVRRFAAQEIKMDQFNQIMAYEAGELDEDQILDLFQNLVNSGLAWQLQGHYGRMAASVVEGGLIERAS